MEDTFDQIAQSWYNFRHHTIFKKELEELAQRWQGGRLLNIGCGHGPDFIPFKDNFDLHGIDISAKMLEMAKKYAGKYNFAVNLIKADARALPFPDESFEHAIAIASYHHIETKEGRQQAFQELYRVLCPGGEAFITVWNRWQLRFWFKKKNAMVPWKSKDRTLYRYYYLFSFNEMENMLKNSGFHILKIGPEATYKGRYKNLARNICALVRKPE